LKESPAQKIFHIFLDRGELSDKQALLLKNSLKAYFKQRGVEYSIELFKNIDSKSCELVQLCDLIIGSVFTKFNRPLKKISPEKREMINYIDNLLNSQVEKYSIPIGTKFFLRIDYSPNGLFRISRPFFEL
jgi:hypothetical protein